MDPTVATIDSNGESQAVGTGFASIQGCKERTIWFNWGNGYCEPTSSMICDYAPVEVRPRVTINVPSSANDGSSVTFTSNVTGGTPTGYQWSFTVPSGSGNDPNLSLSSETSSNTNATAKWFAHPNGACTAPNSSTYTVKLTVSFSDRGPITQQKSFTVNVPWNKAGETKGNVSVSGGPEIDQDSSGTWYVVSIGTWNVTTNPSVQMEMPNSSQFYTKMFAHEQFHVGQWAQPNGLLGSNYSNAGLFAAIQKLTDTTQSGLLAKIATAGNEYLDTQDAVVRGLCNQAEIAAYNASDSLTPQYLYQTCERTTFSNCH